MKPGKKDGPKVREGKRGGKAAKKRRIDVSRAFDAWGTPNKGPVNSTSKKKKKFKRRDSLEKAWRFGEQT